ncbi:MAG TPA: DinB family protein [Pyrinomonadaceae bacterium]|nr:DinB family protein [Pyrinomonadaceae bacterium]
MQFQTTAGIYEANDRIPVQTIAKIYEANDRIRAKLKETLAGVTEHQVAVLPDGEKWSIAQIAEHVSMVGNGMYRICAKLLSKAEANGQLSDGTVDLKAFSEKALGIADIKLEAPEIVQPTGTRSIAESIRSLDETQEAFNRLRPLFEKYDASEPKFPHPYLGDMTAVEWLAMYGGHEVRHLRQIKRLLERIG